MTLVPKTRTGRPPVATVRPLQTDSRADRTIRKSPTTGMPSRKQLEALLADDPSDVFLRYAVAMAAASEGDIEDAITLMADLVADEPDYVPAWFQRGQLLAGAGRPEEARGVLVAGIEVARRTGDAHAAGEMTEFVESL